MIILVLLLFFAILALAYRPRLSKAQTREKAVYLSLLLISFCVLVLYSLDISVPSPSTGIIWFLEPFLRKKG